ncbi:MAG: hypothetical protein KIH89_003520 [Candidatus Shapirobacteria bacterium]|nr:hypothetical protein [Candidatus Shapirobacteria bacterium]
MTKTFEHPEESGISLWLKSKNMREILLSGENATNIVDTYRDERSNLDKELGEVLFFDSEKEVDYLDRVEEDKRYIALSQELKTAVQELFFIQGGSFDRVLEGGRLKDPVANTFIDQFMTADSLDMVALRKIEESLNGGDNLVVHFSPQNADLGYTCDVVDFWINKHDDEKIKFLRFFVDDNFEKLKSIYEHFGGREEIHSPNDMLINPLVTSNFKMADVMSRLSPSDKKIETTKNRIDNVVDEIMDSFYENFGNGIFSSASLIDRIYSGVLDAISEGGSFSEVKIRWYLDNKIEVYMYAPIMGMRVREKMSGACPGIVKTAEFGSKMMVVKENGSLVFKSIDNTDNLTKCSACGFYYSGDRCPLCS